MKLTRLFAAAATLAAALWVRPAYACGGCFSPPVERTVVTDHRMALALSPQQTVLWDQIRYSGDPKEFAWVLPVRAGARVELSTDAWFAALDASTQPVVTGPTPPGTRSGCGLGGCSSSATTSTTVASGPGSSVQVVSESVVGPYETVTLRSSDPGALTTWLQGHAYDIPASIAPVIAAYVDGGFDFIALRLLPTCGERAMRPVRVVTNGADPTLPLRMVAAGVGAQVGITLYVVSEGRYRPQNFPSAEIDDDALRWDRAQNKSTYDTLSHDLMAQADGHTWITEFAGQPQLQPTAFAQRGYGAYGASPGLADAYFAKCFGLAASGSPPSATPTYTPCPDTQSSPGLHFDASIASPEAGLPDGPDPNDAPSTPPEPQGPCDAYDDLALAVSGLHTQDVWVTRLRALLPSSALAEGDLRLEAAPAQTTVSNLHYAALYTDQGGCASASGSRARDWSAVAGLALVAIAWGRRRARDGNYAESRGPVDFEKK